MRLGSPAALPHAPQTVGLVHTHLDRRGHVNAQLGEQLHRAVWNALLLHDGPEHRVVDPVKHLFEVSEGHVEAAVADGELRQPRDAVLRIPGSPHSLETCCCAGYVARSRVGMSLESFV